MALQIRKDRLDEFLKWTGTVVLVVFGGLFILTLFAPVPPFEFWLTGAAFYQCSVFLFASIVGVLGLRKIIARSFFWAGMSVAVLLTGAVWWQTAEQAFATHEQNTRAKETNDLVKEIATALKVDPEGSTRQVAQAVVERLKERVSSLENRGTATATITDPTWAAADIVGQVAAGLLTINYGGVKSGIVIGATGNGVSGILAVPLSRQPGLNQPYRDPTAHTDLGEHRWYMSQVTGAYLILVPAARKTEVVIRYRFEDQPGETNIVTWKTP